MDVAVFVGASGVAVLVRVEVGKTGVAVGVLPAQGTKVFKMCSAGVQLDRKRVWGHLHRAGNTGLEEFVPIVRVGQETD